MLKNMKKVIYLMVSIFVINIISINIASSTMEVIGLHSTSHETAPSGPYTLTQIEMEWSLPDGYTKSQISKFYYVFTSSNSNNLTTATEIQGYTGNEEVDPDDYMGDTFTITKNIDDFIDEDHVQYWFHVAGVGLGYPLIMGDSVHAGPYQIDVYPPTNPYIKEINEKSITNDSEITLSMSASKGLGGVNCVRYWFLGQAKPINCSVKEDFPFVTSEEFPNYEQGSYPKTYTIMAEFEDEAGNKSSTASYQIQYTPEDLGTITYMAGIPTLTEWGIIIFMGIILISSFVILRRKSIKVIKYKV